MKYKVLLFTLIILSSCSSDKISYSPSHDVNVVDIDSSKNHSKGPLIDDELKSSGVGPQMESETTLIKPSFEKNKMVIGLYLGPGLNRVINQVMALKALKEAGIDINIVSGVGMGAIVAAYFATDTSPELIEWKFHKFFQNTKSLKPFSKDWLSRVETDLLDKFKGQSIQSTKLTLILPLSNVREGTVEYLTRGELYDKLLSNLRLKKTASSEHVSLLSGGQINLKEFKKLGVDKLIGVDTLGNKIRFKMNEDYLFGIYGKFSSLSPFKVKNNELDHVMQLPVESMYLDNIQGLPKFMRASYIFSQSSVKQIKDEMEKGKIDD